ncbi:MAG: hypothetical protein R6T83_00080 [Salinibacter sp.]
MQVLSLVVDEYGGVAGVVTMEDVVETLLGLEIVDEADSVEDMQALARKQWFKRARELGMLSEEAFEAISSVSSKDGLAPAEALPASDDAPEEEVSVSAPASRGSSPDSDE